MGIVESANMGTSASRSKRRCQLCKNPAEAFCIHNTHFILLCDHCVSRHNYDKPHYCYTVSITQLEQFELFERNSFELPQGQLQGTPKQPDYCDVANTKRADLSFARINNGMLCMWTFSMGYRKTPLSFPIMEAESFVWMDSSLFCSNYSYYTGKGTWKGGKQFTCEIQQNGRVTRLPDMLLPREGRALWWYSAGQEVFAFGGMLLKCKRCGDRCSSPYNCFSLVKKPKFRECEALSCHSISWRALPNMKGSRFVWCACEFLQYIYICGGDSIEIFDPRICLFLDPLSVSLPKATVAVVENSQLIVISCNLLTRFEAGEGSTLELISQVGCDGNARKTSQPSVVDSVNGIIYSLYGKENEGVFRLDTPDKKVRIPSFTSSIDEQSEPEEALIRSDYARFS